MKRADLSCLLKMEKEIENLLNNLVSRIEDIMKGKRVFYIKH